MMIDNPVTRFMLRAMSICGVAGSQRDSGSSRGGRIEQKDSPFVLCLRVLARNSSEIDKQVDYSKIRPWKGDEGKD